jgi:uncharacterized membrane protein YheB (UPF0754 family)
MLSIQSCIQEKQYIKTHQDVQEQDKEKKSPICTHQNVISKEEFEKRIQVIRNYTDEQICEQISETEENITLEEIKQNRNSFIRTLVLREHIVYDYKDPVPLK